MKEKKLYINIIRHENCTFIEEIFTGQYFSKLSLVNIELIEKSFIFNGWVLQPTTMPLRKAINL